MRQGNGAVPRTALAVLEHMQSEKCRWQKWMPPRRELEKWDRGGGKEAIQEQYTNTLY